MICPSRADPDTFRTTSKRRAVTLARTNAIGGNSLYPAMISIPSQLNRENLRLGVSGTATVYAENAGVIGIIATILLWVSAYTTYL